MPHTNQQQQCIENLSDHFSSIRCVVAPQRHSALVLITQSTYHGSSYSEQNPLSVPEPKENRRKLNRFDDRFVTDVCKQHAAISGTDPNTDTLFRSTLVFDSSPGASSTPRTWKSRTLGIQCFSSRGVFMKRDTTVDVMKSSAARRLLLDPKRLEPSSSVKSCLLFKVVGE